MTRRRDLDLWDAPDPTEVAEIEEWARQARAEQLEAERRRGHRPPPDPTYPPSPF